MAIENKAAYWIDPRGKILRIAEPLHITQIIRTPEKFKLTKKEVLATYEKYGEKVGAEGKAREELMLKVLKIGFIRIRLYPNYWSVTVQKFGNKEKKAIQVWAKEAQNNKVVGKYADVKILELSKDKVREYELDELVDGDHLFEARHQLSLDNYLPIISELKDFGFNENIFNRLNAITSGV